MTLILMAIVGFAAGFVLDAGVAQLAREPYEREPDEAEAEAEHSPLGLGSEMGALAMPALLTTRSLHRRVVIVTATTLVFALLGWRYAGHPAALAIVAAYAAVLILCTATDILSYRVPNAVTYPAILLALAVGMLMPDANRLDVLAGGLIFGGLLFVPSIVTGGAMGMGDVKLALFVGLALGLALVVPAMLVMAIAGGIAATFLLVTRIRAKGDPIPYAPFIAGGALVVLLLQGAAFLDL